MPFPAIPPIATARLTIAPLSEAHLDDLLVFNGDDAVTRFLPYATWASRADADAWLLRMQALAAAGSGQQFVLLQRPDDRAIGSLLLFRHDEGSGRVELGYVLGRAHWGQGLMGEAVAAVCAHAFAVAGLRRIEAEVNPANQASCRLLQSAGFVHEGRLRQRWVVKGAAVDTNLYGLLADDWRARQA